MRILKERQETELRRMKEMHEQEMRKKDEVLEEVREKLDKALVELDRKQVDCDKKVLSVRRNCELEMKEGLEQKLIQYQNQIQLLQMKTRQAEGAS